MKKNSLFSAELVNQIRNYSLRIGERLYKRLSKHIQFLKHLNSIQNKQEWVEGAILSRLKKEELQEVDECIPQEKHLSFKISSQIDARVEKRVEAIKKIRGSFSKKQWILEAIHERLDLEEKETKEKAQKLLKNMLEDTYEISSK